MSSRSVGRASLSPEEIARRAEAERLRRAEEDRRQRELARQQALGLVKLAESLRRQAAAHSVSEVVRRTSQAAKPMAALPPTHEQQTAEMRASMLESIKQLSMALVSVPVELQKIRAGRFARIRAELKEIEACRDNNFTMHRPRLKSLRDELARAMEDPAEMVERCLDAVVTLTVLQSKLNERSHLVPATEVPRCHAILRHIEDLLAAGDLDLFDGAMPALVRDGTDLIDRIDDAALRRANDSRLREAIAATLGDLGYEAAELPRSCAQAADDLIFQTPADGLVRLSLTGHMIFEAEYVHLTRGDGDLDAEEFSLATQKCRQWCQDVGRLQRRLDEVGIRLEIESEIPPERGGFAVVAVEAPQESAERKHGQHIEDDEHDQERQDEYR